MWLLNKIKKIISFFIVESFKFIYRGVLTLLTLFVIIIVISNALEKKRIERLNTQYSYVSINLGRTFKEGEIDPLMSLLNNDMNYFSLQKMIKRMGEDLKVKGIIFNLDGFNLSSAQSEEIGKLIKKFSNEKKIYMYSNEYNRNSYEFALNGEIIAPPTNSAHGSITGYRISRPFFKRLGEKMGVSFTVVSTGDYKSFGENLTRTTMSEHSKGNTLALLNKLFDRLVDKISVERSIERSGLEEKILNGDFAMATPMNLKENNLVDKLSYYYDLEESLGRSSIISLEEYYAIYQNIGANDNENIKNSIALITLDGEIRHAGNLEQGQGITYETTEEMVRLAMEDQEVKGIVLRINSPGGSALTSELIHHMIQEMKKQYEKPVYVSMGSVAASGGYYISTIGDKIFANETTLTGSIGVVSVIPNVEQLTNKIGVDIVELTNGKNTNLHSITEMPTDERLAILKNASRGIYKEFKERVAKGRKMSIEDVEIIAQGIVWTGLDGVNIQLVDSIGTLEDTIEAVARELKLASEEYQVKEIKIANAKDNFKKHLKFLLVNNSIKEVVSQYVKTGEIKSNELFGIETNRPVLYTDIEIR